MNHEKEVPDFTEMDHQLNEAAYTTETIVTNSNLDLNISTEEQNTVEVISNHL
ncbi:hypothetical protein V7122_23840 [Bacillus sp. JJ1532]|uniref:hypothetical protein n=1 Tax=Bacillus sp. JJ1532 TaxID=3122958 RepID=UPI002FFE98B2